MLAYNIDGHISMGIGDGIVSIDQNVIAQPAANGGWFNDSLLLFAQAENLWLYNLYTGERILASARGANVFKGGGDVWAAWLNGYGFFTSKGLYLPEAGFMDVSVDGAIAYKENYQAAISSIVIREFSDQEWTLPSIGVVWDLQLLGDRSAIWSEGSPSERSVLTCGLAPKVTVTRNGNLWRPQAVFGAGRWWVYYYSEGNGWKGVVCHPFDDIQGFVVEEGEDAFGCVARAWSNNIQFAWSVREGERPEDLRQRTINVTTQELIDLNTLGTTQAITPIARPHWMGFFAGHEGSGGGWDTTTDPRTLPGNAYLLIPEGNFEDKSEKPVGSYVQGGTVEEIEDAARQVSYTPIAYWDARSWPRYPNLPKGSWLCIQAYMRKDETPEAFEAAISAEIRKAPFSNIALVCQCYTSNATLTDDLTQLVPIFSRLVVNHPQVIATIPFSGSGRRTGLQDHPEVRPLWDEYASTIPSTPDNGEIPPKPQGGIILILAYDRTVRRSDPKGHLVRYQVESERPVIKLELKLIEDGEPPVMVFFSDTPRQDGRYIRGLAWKPVKNGTYQLKLRAWDEDNQLYESSGDYPVTVTE
jgi:hypothetical protein